MRILLLFLLFTNVSCWSLNDLYGQLLDGNKKLFHRRRHHNDKKTKRTYIGNSNLWSQNAAAPPSYEVQSYDVETKIPNRQEKSRVASVKPTAPITEFNHADPLMKFNRLYGVRKPQVSAWTEWTQHSAAAPVAFVPLVAPNHERASKKHDPIKPLKNKTQEVTPTQGISIFHGSFISDEHALKANVKPLIESTNANIFPKTTSNMFPSIPTEKKDVKNVTTKKVATEKVDTSGENLLSATTHAVEHSFKTPGKQSFVQTNFENPASVQYPGPSFDMPCNSTTGPCPTSPVMIASYNTGTVHNNNVSVNKLQNAPKLDIDNDPNNLLNSNNIVDKIVDNIQNRDRDNQNQLADNHVGGHYVGDKQDNVGNKLNNEDKQHNNNKEEHKINISEENVNMKKKEDKKKQDTPTEKVNTEANHKPTQVIVDVKHNVHNKGDTKQDTSSQVLKGALQELKEKVPNTDEKSNVYGLPNDLGEEANQATQKTKEQTELPDIRGLLSTNYNKKVYKFGECRIDAVSNTCGVHLKVSPSTCDGKISFTALMTRLLSYYDLAAPSNELIVHGKFDVSSFSVDRCKGHVSFGLNCRELLDIIPNKLRIAKAKVMLNFSYEQKPKTISNFYIKLNGLLNLDFRNRRLDALVVKPLGSTLFNIEMTTMDLELPEFTKLFTDAEIPQQDLPPDLATLVTSSLRNPRITGLYDSSGAFEFIASAKSPASIFPSQPMVYVIIQKPRLGKVVSGLIASFESAMYRSFLSSILNQDLSNIPLFTDVRTDMAIGVSPDGLFVVKDESFNREVGSLFNTGRTIRKGLTVKAKLPVRKMLSENLMNLNSTQRFPEIVLINVEVKGNKMHIEFPEELRIGLLAVSELFAQRGQQMNFPTESLDLDKTLLKIKAYEIDNVDKKSISVFFSAPESMKIGSLIVLDDVEATLKRDELSKWSFVAKGDYKLGNTSVPISLTSQSKGFIISSKPSSIRSGLLVSLLDQRKDLLQAEMRKYHLDDFVIEDFEVSGSLTARNIIRFAGKPAVFDVEDGRIEFVATEELDKINVLTMGVLFRNVDLDTVFGRMLDKKMQRRSWASGVNVGLIISPLRTVDFQFESEGLEKAQIQPGVHLRVLVTRPEFTLCKGDSLCRVLSSEMPRGSAFHLDGAMMNGILGLSASIDEPLILTKSLQLTGVSLQVRVEDSIQIFVLGSLNLKGVGVTFSGNMQVSNTGQLQLNMVSSNIWDRPFGLLNVHFGNCSLNAVFEPGLPVPMFELKARMFLGKENMNRIEANALVKISSNDPSKNSFSAKLPDMSFEKFAQACGTKKPLLRFQETSVFTDEAVLSYEQTNKDADAASSVLDEGNSTEYNYKGELKVSGRIRILGQNSEYTMKFLQKESQILTEIWLPDIGVNQGLLTIRAGLKQQRSDTKAANGPTLLIRMDSQTNSAVIVGKISTLGFSRISAIKVEDSGFSASIYANLPGNVNTNVTIMSKYDDNIQNADFLASACLPIQQDVKVSLFKLLKNTATQTKKTLISAEERVTTTEKIYETTKDMIDKYKKRSVSFTADIRQRAEVMNKLRMGIKKHCVKDCGDSCMGLPSWKKSGIALAGRNAIGAPTWDGCRRKIPDLNCITRCLGRKVIENVKANNKQMELQSIMGSLADTKRSLQDARALVNRSRNLVDSTLDDLEKVNREIKVGVDISKFLNDGKAEDAIIMIEKICFRDSLDNAERSLVKFIVALTVSNVEKKLIIEAALDGNLVLNIAEGVANKLYPGFFEFSKKLEQVKVLLSNLDGEKAEIAKEIDKTSDNSAQNEQRSQVVWNSEEDEFRKLAFGELPRFTLSDDETIHAFEEKSLWQMAPSNNPLFDNAPGDNQIMSKKIVDSSTLNKEFDKKTFCGQIRSSVERYSDIINPLSEFTENFLQEKIMFYRQKNRRFADLRMIDDQIKSDCFLENCTMEDMDNALSYLGRARDGTLKWSNVIDNQIEQQNKVALSYFSKRTADIIEADKGVSLRQYITKVKEFAQNAIKKSDIVMKHKSETDEKIQKLAKELHSLLLGVRTGDELSKAAPKIFNMKRQIQSLKRNKIPCSEKPENGGKKSPRGKQTNKLRAININTIKKANNTAMKTPSKTLTPTKTLIKHDPTTSTVAQYKDVTEAPVLKHNVPTYLDNINILAPHSVGASSDEGEILAANNKFTQSELINTPQNMDRYFFNNNSQQSSPYNPFQYWSKYVKK